MVHAECVARRRQLGVEVALQHLARGRRACGSRDTRRERLQLVADVVEPDLLAVGRVQERHAELALVIEAARRCPGSSARPGSGRLAGRRSPSWPRRRRARGRRRTGRSRPGRSGRELLDRQARPCGWSAPTDSNGTTFHPAAFSRGSIPATSVSCVPPPPESDPTRESRERGPAQNVRTERKQRPLGEPHISGIAVRLWSAGVLSRVAGRSVTLEP